MKKALFLMLLAIPTMLQAQNAHVVALDKTDAQEAREKWDKLQKAQAEWDAFQERVHQDYVYVSPSSKDASKTVISASTPKQGNWTYRAGFENGFAFSTDFKFIVPVQAKVEKYYGGCFTMPNLMTPSSAPTPWPASYFSTSSDPILIVPRGTAAGPDLSKPKENK